MTTRKSSTGSSFFSLKRTKSTHDDSSDSQDHRRRITIACVRCRKRKIRCDGAAECSKCVAAKHVCEYIPVTKEENMVARERKTAARIARAASNKLPKLVTDSASKVLERRRRTVTKLNVKRHSSSATPEPSPTDYVNQSQTEASQYTLPSPISPTFPGGGSGDPRIFFSDGRAVHPQYMDYRSPSTASLHSEHESDFYSTDMSLPPTPTHPNFEEGNYFTPRFTNPFASSTQDLSTGNNTVGGLPQPTLNRSYSTPFMQQMQHGGLARAPPLQHSHSYHPDAGAYSTPPPPPSASYSTPPPASPVSPHHQSSPGLSFPSFSSAPPAGLCLYIPGPNSSGPSFTPSPSYVSQSQPSSPAHSTPPMVRSPTNNVVYASGPIDWTRRPLAPFPSVLLPPPSAGAGITTLPSPAPSIPYASINEPMLSSYQHRDSLQTVRMDQISSLQ